MISKNRETNLSKNVEQKNVSVVKLWVAVTEAVKKYSYCCDDDRVNHSQEEENRPFAIKLDSVCYWNWNEYAQVIEV